MQMFGLDIRRANDIAGLLRNVDRVLDENKITSGVVPVDLKYSAVVHKLNKMLKPSGYCCICDIKEMAEMVGLCISKERLTFYRTQHCVYWNEMTVDFREQVVAMILDDFRSILMPPPVETEAELLP